jgi:uncharacterized protein YyaL (SSP411 family)
LLSSTLLAQLPMRWDPALDAALQALAQMQPMMSQYPLGFGQWLQALSYTLARPKEIAIIGERQKADTRAMLRVAAGNYQPFQIIALGDPNTRTPAVPLLEDRKQIDGRATAYVCVDFSCRAPVTEPEALRSLLETAQVPHLWIVGRNQYETSRQREARRIGLCTPL